MLIARQRNSTEIISYIGHHKLGLQGLQILGLLLLFPWVLTVTGNNSLLERLLT